METNTEQKLVMLIDDTPEDLYINNRFLEKYGNNNSILQFNMALSAMEYLKSHQSDISKIPDIIFLDIHMPLMNGFEFLEEYEKLTLGIKSKSKVYMLTSSFDSDDIRKAKANHNVKELLEKPLNKMIVEKIINKNCIN